MLFVIVVVHDAVCHVIISMCGQQKYKIYVREQITVIEMNDDLIIIVLTNFFSVFFSVCLFIIGIYLFFLSCFSKYSRQVIDFH